MDCLFLALGWLDAVDDSLVAAEPHHGFDDQPEHLHVDVELINFGEVGQADLSKGLPVGFQFCFQGFFLLLAHIVQACLESELFDSNLQFFPCLVDKLRSWIGIFLLLFGLGIMVLVLISLFVEFDVEEVDGPK